MFNNIKAFFIANLVFFGTIGMGICIAYLVVAAIVYLSTGELPPPLFTYNR